MKAANQPDLWLALVEGKANAADHFCWTLFLGQEEAYARNELPAGRAQVRPRKEIYRNPAVQCAGEVHHIRVKGHGNEFLVLATQHRLLRHSPPLGRPTRRGEALVFDVH